MRRYGPHEEKDDKKHNQEEGKEETGKEKGSWQRSAHCEVGNLRGTGIHCVELRYCCAAAMG